MWNAKTPGIPDELFDRDENVPITKEEVRVVQISKARLKPGMIVYDIGCGSGSISVEAAHQVEESGHVHAVDYDAKAVELTKKNLEKFHYRSTRRDSNQVLRRDDKSSGALDRSAILAR